MLPLRIVTLVLDGMPWLANQVAIFNALPSGINWEWHIAHGVSANIADTRWMASQLPRLSVDGTTEYLEGLAEQHPRVRVHTKKLWLGKTVQINACLTGMTAPCVLLQVDSDELWTAEQITEIVELFGAMPEVGAMQFRCDFMLGPNIRASREGSYGCRQAEWMRAWRVTDTSQRFVTHEPPNFRTEGRLMTREETGDRMLIFRHEAYSTLKTVAYKEVVYKYTGAVAGWKRLQANKTWPTKLKPFLHWADADAEADLLVHP